MEGKNDKLLLQSITEAPILITNGIGYHDNLIAELQNLESIYSIHLLLDPDGPGEKIRATLRKVLINPVDVYVPKDLSINKKGTKVGIEHVSRETLAQYIQQGLHQTKVDMLSIIDLQLLGLTGGSNAKNKRKVLCETLNIGLSNAKTLRYKLMIYGYDYVAIKQALEGLD